MNTLSTIGTLTKKNQIENIENKEGKKWIKQTFLIDIGQDYNSTICFQLFGDEKVKLLESFNIGDKIEVFFNISSREYNNRYYHNIDAWKINHANNNKTNPTHENKEDELPF